MDRCKTAMVNGRSIIGVNFRHPVHGSFVNNRQIPPGQPARQPTHQQEPLKIFLCPKGRHHKTSLLTPATTTTALPNPSCTPPSKLTYLHLHA
ncbi:hypothetical protein E2C01_075988 [Portunus trituberculatus]|uniref:Uncharacterized protein n=1 Tax=Portunus trituberculatus TaxID=210409 RepID=A0A5B7IGP1_PORTR|nr:hypothetical protein [Portunus trituberculatus]